MSVIEEYKQSKERAMQDRIEVLERRCDNYDKMLEKAADSLKEHEDAIYRLQERMDSIRQWAKDVNEMMKERTNGG